eukprot:c11525_g1_i1.p1 GENE.c11525_g1_i1~~c11525_g1_i1.p1  ORF type:complete len:390 (+),score=90.33 c11525_g1_i1:74-1171(+)
MDTHPWSVPVQTKACRLLERLTQNIHNRKRMVSAGAPSRLCHALEIHLEELEVCQSVCNAFNAMTTERNCVSFMSQEDGLAYLMKILESHKMDSQLTANVLLTMSNVLTRLEESSRKAVSHEMIRLVRSSMQRHLSNLEVCSSGMRFMKEIRDSRRVVTTEKEEDDWMKAVMNGMQTFETDPDIQANGCGILCALCDQTQIRETFASQIVIRVITAMSRHFWNRDVIEACLTGLREISVFVEITEFITPYLAHILKAMETHNGDETIQIDGLIVLVNIGSQCQDIDELAGFEIVPSALRAMSGHVSCLMVQRYATQLLSIFSTPAFTTDTNLRDFDVTACLNHAKKILANDKEGTKFVSAATKKW